MRRILTLLLALALLLLGNLACELTDEPTVPNVRAPELPAELLNYQSPQLPEHMTGTFVAFGGNVFDLQPNSAFDPILGSGTRNPKVTDAGATLGRVLFYDRNLSVNNVVSCGSCHLQEKAFADGEVSSVGFGGKKTPRNSMAIVNAALNQNLFWDSRVESVTELVLEPVQNHIEMGMESLDYLEEKLTALPYYPSLFEAAYGNAEITREHIGDALAQFVCSMISVDSRFDQVQQNNGIRLTALEQEGFMLFNSTRTNCSGCHAGLNFAAPDFPGGAYSAPDVKGSANIGLNLDYTDQGLGNGRFRIPSLRNIALTAPYMHDGRFGTLEEVVDHYNENIRAHPALDDKLKDDRGLPVRMQLDNVEKKALIAFLKTLTSESLLQEEKFSDPFN